ncbi:MAG: hypothetical protein IPK16_16295 [Anaerolineales bacterium]|nr:hypothetical protein [Anaerolineales bacterium]
MSAAHRHAKQLLTGEIGGKRALRALMQRVALQLPYFDALRWLGWWSRQPAVANRLYAEERDLFYRFVGDIGSPVESWEQRFRTNLFANCIGQCMSTVIVRQEGIFPDRLTAWSHSHYRFARTLAEEAQLRPGGDSARLIAFTGLEHLAEASTAGNGLILVTYHGAVTFIASPLLTLYGGIGSIQVVSAQRAWKAAVRQSSADRSEVAERWQAVKASELLAARRHLSDRGAIQFVIDGLSSAHDGVDRTIFGYAHRIVAGLSSLAKATNSPVLPLMNTIDPSGQVGMEFYPRFRLPAPAAREDEWLASMADQCALFLQASWRQAPESLSWAPSGGTICCQTWISPEERIGN